MFLIPIHVIGNAKMPVRQSRRLEGKFKEGDFKDMVDECDEDFSSSETEDYDDSSDDFEEDWRKKPRDKEPLTDDEASDTNELRLRRRHVRQTTRDKIQAKFDQPSRCSWEPDAQDLEDMKSAIIIPFAKKCGKVRKLKPDIPDDVMDDIGVGILPKGKNRKFVAKTPQDLEYALRKLLFVLESLTRKDFPDLLINSHLHIRQFWAFKTEHFIPPQNIIHILEEHFDYSPSLKEKMLNAYVGLLKEVCKRAGSTEGLAKFCTPVTPEEKSWSKEKMLCKGGKMQDQFISKVNNIIFLMKIDNPYGQYEGEREANHRKKVELQKEYEGRCVPNPMKVIPQWLNHHSTVEMDRKLMDYAQSKKVVSGKELEDFGTYLILLLESKGANRKDVWENLTWGEYLTGRRKKYAAHPHEPVHLNPDVDINDPEVRKNLTFGKDGNITYCRPDPWAPDPHDPLDPMKDEEKWLVLRGICVSVRFHKTGASTGDAYVWFSLLDDVRMLCYEQISRTYAESFGKAVSNDDVIFINAQFHSLAANGINFTQFCEVTDLPYLTTITFRKMMSEHAFDHKDITFRDNARFTKNHSSSTNYKFYVQDEVKKTLALTASTRYRGELSLAEECAQLSDTQVFISEDQDRRLSIAMAEMDETKLNRYLEKIKRKDSERVPTLKAVIGSAERVAILQTICAAGESEIPVTRHGNVMDLFLSGKPVVNFKCVKVILRLINMVPSEFEPRKILEDNIVSFAGLMANEEISVRKLEVLYAFKMLKCLKNMQFNKAIDHPRVIAFFGNLSEKYGLKYVMGNSALLQQVKHWLTNSNRRKKERSWSDKKRLTPSQWRAEHNLNVDKLMLRDSTNKVNSAAGKSFGILKILLKLSS